MTGQSTYFKVPSEYRYEYCFSGIIHPERAHVVLYDIGWAKVQAVFAQASLMAFMHIVGDNGRFTASMHTQAEVPDLLTLRNCVREFVASRVDIVCFYQGAYFNVEVVSCRKPSGEEITFGVELTAIQDLAKGNPKRAPVMSLMTHGCAPFLQAALRDYRRAMQDPLEAYFFVFRAIESIRGYYALRDGLDPERDKKATWKSLRDHLGYEEKDFELIKTRATARRHGEVHFHSETEIVECLSFGWLFASRFIEMTFGTEFVVPPAGS